MKNYSVYTLFTGAYLFTTSLSAQIQTSPNSTIQSFTNADLNQTTEPNTLPSTSATSANAGANPSTGFKYPALTADQMQQMNSQMSTQIQNAEQRVQNLMTKVQDATRMPMSIDKVELEGAILAT